MSSINCFMISNSWMRSPVFCPPGRPGLAVGLCPLPGVKIAPAVGETLPIVGLFDCVVGAGEPFAVVGLIFEIGNVGVGLAVEIDGIGDVLAGCVMVMPDAGTVGVTDGGQLAPPAQTNVGITAVG